jgi:hypothetical protein
MNRYLALIIAVTVVGAALLSSQIPHTSQPGWLTDPKTGCRVWDPVPQQETISWTGSCENNLAQGRGVLQWSKDGKPTDRYEGDVRDGKMNGRGVLTAANGDRYDGEYRDGGRSGRGIYILANGDRYDGEWLNGKRNGRGVVSWANGDRYDGGWLDDKRNGRGVLTSASGLHYEGEFRDNRPNGTGTLTSADGKRTYSGQWTNGCFRDGNRRATAGPTMKECGFE